MKQKIIKQKWLLLVLAVLLLIPAGFTMAKYAETQDVGTVTLNIQADPTVIDTNWQSEYPSGITKIVLDSYNSQAGNLNGQIWDNGMYVGVKDENNSFTGGVRLFREGETAYILARKNRPVVFPENAQNLFGGLGNKDTLESIEFNNIDTSSTVNMLSMFQDCSELTSLDLSRFDTTNAADMQYMFSGCVKLRKVTLGTAFQFRNCVLPVPESSYITDADGMWHIGQDISLTPESVVTHQVTVTETTTYYAVASEALAAATADAPDDDEGVSPAVLMMDPPFTPDDADTPDDVVTMDEPTSHEELSDIQ